MEIRARKTGHLYLNTNFPGCVRQCLFRYLQCWEIPCGTSICVMYSFHLVLLWAVSVAAHVILFSLLFGTGKFLHPLALLYSYVLLLLPIPGAVITFIRFVLSVLTLIPALLLFFKVAALLRRLTINMTLIIIHQIVWLMQDWSKCHTWQNIPS